MLNITRNIERGNFMSPRITLSVILSAILLVSCATSIDTEPVLQPAASPVNVPGSTPIVAEEPTNASGKIESLTPAVSGYLTIPAEIVPAPGSFTDDVESSGTAAEGRAPYGDSLDLNRFERPFLKDMTYIPDVDIRKFGLSWDTDWYYVSVKLVGVDPNNGAGINYGVEIDRDADGYGDYIVWAHPPYASAWDTVNVQVFEDTNKDTGGRNVVRAEEVFQGDGYDKLVFDGAASQSDDPDLAWVRWNAEADATLQFAFKRTLAGDSFMFGVVADVGLKDVSMYDYADRFTPAEAGSPVRDKQNYPLSALSAVDNTCWVPHGFTSTGYEPKVCPPILQPVIKPANDQPSGCNPPPNCDGNGGGAYDPVTCECQ